jgi:hypothetical protein
MSYADMEANPVYPGPEPVKQEPLADAVLAQPTAVYGHKAVVPQGK